MTEDTGLDLVGVGKLAKAIPQKAWIQVVDTACKTFSAALAPFTALTSGVGRLIEAKFDRFVDAEKVLAAGTMVRAQEKVSKSKRKPIGNAKASVCWLPSNHRPRKQMLSFASFGPICLPKRSWTAKSTRSSRRYSLG